MPAFTQTLERALHQALTLANEREHEYATLEHLLLALIAMGVLDRWVPVVQLVTGPVRWVAAVPILLGLVLAGSAARAFGRAGTPVVPFEPSTALVTTGWYRYTRNPMYLGMSLLLSGIALALGSLTAFLPVPLFVLIVQTRFIRAEERFLEGIFGTEYTAYKARVRRWL